MTETLISLPGRDYQLKVAVKIDVAGNRANFLADAHKLRESLAAAFDEAIEKASCQE
jgi:hypothetical protein